MKALILAGGKGMRLLPLTKVLPKPMVPIVNKPFLHHLIEYLKSYGINEIILSLGYKGEEIKKYFDDGKNFGVKIYYVEENTPLGTGGAIKNAEDLIDDQIIIFNGDILTDIDLEDLINYHKAKKGLVTIALTRVEDPSQYGVVLLDESSQIKSFIEKPKKEEAPSNLINAGIYVFEKEILNYIPKGREVSLEKEIYPVLLKENIPIYGFEFDGYWLDIGNLHKYLKANKDMLLGKIKLPTSKMITTNKIVMGENTEVHPKAKIEGPVIIGDNTVIDKNSEIHPMSVIGNNVIIEKNAKIKESIIWDNAKIGENAYVENSVIASHRTISDNEKIISNAVA
ncbi:MAG: nucleotidyltransferase [Dictyoglomus sp. NZ13-RE01]|nr:MAG: nucleotidyltransferase [Dictyoglomus sp. NZ13-RE01]